jgi:hypothetical protein
VTFVSVKQAFNTTISLGRLTLNILLSFAQFERELICERIRDKFAASRKRGIWMGGRVPLGYDVKNRKLEVNSAGADQVRRIFDGFTKTGSVTCLVTSLRAEGLTSKSGRRLDKGYVYKMLHNRTYIGEAPYKGESYPGEHEAIIPHELWDRVHAAAGKPASPRQQEPQSDADAAARLDLRRGWPSHVAHAHAAARTTLPGCGKTQDQGSALTRWGRPAPDPDSLNDRIPKASPLAGSRGGARGLPFIPYRTAPLEFFRSLLPVLCRAGRAEGDRHGCSRAGSSGSGRGDRGAGD